MKPPDEYDPVPTLRATHQPGRNSRFEFVSADVLWLVLLIGAPCLLIARGLLWLGLGSSGAAITMIATTGAVLVWRFLGYLRAIAIPTQGHDEIGPNSAHLATLRAEQNQPSLAITIGMIVGGLLAMIGLVTCIRDADLPFGETSGTTYGDVMIGFGLLLVATGMPSRPSPRRRRKNPITPAVPHAPQ
jgi:type III secretory pathway component EscS